MLNSAGIFEEFEEIVCQNIVFIQSVIYIFLSCVSTIKEFDTLQCPPFTVVSHVEADVANPVLRG